MMIKSFFLDHLLVASLIVGGLWLLVVWFFCLRRKTGSSSPPLAHRWQKDVDELGNVGSGSADLMGKPALEEGVTVLAAEEFSFAERADLKVDKVMEKSEQLGLIADVQQEIKSVCAVLAQKDGTKEDFFSMFELIRIKYPKMAGHGALAELRSFIRERVPFHLSDEELDGLWS